MSQLRVGTNPIQRSVATPPKNSTSSLENNNYEWAKYYWYLLDQGPIAVERLKDPETGKIKKSDWNNIKDLYNSYKSLLPCEDCKAHYRSLLEITPIETVRPSELGTWIAWVKDEVRKNVEAKKEERERLRREKEIAEHTASLEARQASTLAYSTYQKHPSQTNFLSIRPVHHSKPQGVFDNFGKSNSSVQKHGVGGLSFSGITKSSGGGGGGGGGGWGKSAGGGGCGCGR